MVIMYLISGRIMMFENEISDAKRVVNEFLEQTALREGNLVVI